MFDLAVIGAGAAGMTAAVIAKRKSPELNTIIVEALPIPGKKLLATGNGRCNLSNLSAEKHQYRNGDFAMNIIGAFGVEQTLEFFRSIGLYTVNDVEGRIYPMSNCAAGVCDALKIECERLGINILTNQKIEKIEKHDGCFIIGGRLRAKKLIVAAGGMASPALGSDGSGFDILKSFGHTINEPKPALVQLTSDNKIVRSFKGQRVKGNMTLFAGDNNIGACSGEILFTDYGLSGIASMDAQRLLCDYLKSEKCSAVIDFVPMMSESELSQAVRAIISRNPKLKSENLISGFVPKKIGQGIIKCAYVKNDCPVGEISADNTDKIIRLLKSFRVYFSGAKSFDNAQITRGGADINEFDPVTLESLKVPGLYCAGEILDVDGACGGFNLQWAWSSAAAAGSAAADKII